MTDAKQQTPAKIAAGCGAAVAVISGVAFLVTAVLMVTSSGRISPDEAAPALLGACCCGLVGLLGALGGVALVIRARRQAATMRAGAGGPPGPAPPA